MLSPSTLSRMRVRGNNVSASHLWDVDVCAYQFRECYG